MPSVAKAWGGISAHLVELISDGDMRGNKKKHGVRKGFRLPPGRLGGEVKKTSSKLDLLKGC